MFHVETYSETMWIETLCRPARPRRAAVPRSFAAGGRVRANAVGAALRPDAWPCAGRGLAQQEGAGGL